MIWVSRLDGTPMVVNVQLIEFIEAVPDTVITLVTGNKLVVRESPDLLIKRAIAFHREAGGTLRAACTSAGGRTGAGQGEPEEGTTP